MATTNSAAIYRQQLRSVSKAADPPAATRFPLVKTDEPVRAMSIAEAGRQLSISRATAYRLIQRGELGSVLIGRRRVVPEKCLRRYLCALIADQLGYLDDEADLTGGLHGAPRA
jgi:excisionase family DNA binding protein